MHNRRRSSAPVICFGEILWDNLPTGRVPGGAPMNVAYHLHRLGHHVLPVTAVGNDEPGRELLQRLHNWGIDTTYVAVVNDLPTGIVNVTLNAQGSASYEIADPCAWDRITVSDPLLNAAKNAQGVIYGTLAARSPSNLHAVLRLLDSTTSAHHILDVNLRPPYYSHERLLQLAAQSTLIKLNDDEAEQLAGMPFNDLQSAAQTIAGKFGCNQICITAGAEGAGLLMDNAWYRVQGERVEVQDTIGAGDAFLAGLADGLLDPDSTPHDALRRASRLGGFVAGKAGATPDYTIDTPPLAEVFNRA